MTLEKPASTLDEPFEDRLNRIVEEFEDARDRNGVADVSAFIPDKNDAWYAEIGIELLRVDLQFGWEMTSPTPLGDYQRRFPDILVNERRLAELAFEDYRMRRLVGHQVDPEEYERQYAIDTTGWPRVSDSTVRMRSASASTVYERHPGLTEDTNSTNNRRELPEIGDRFLDFELLCEIGRGAFAKVFLATQPELADRNIVLKITTAPNAEAQQLARLQHTNIVPIHSVHCESNLHAVCMPDFGPCTLYDALHRIQHLAEIPNEGSVFVDAIGDRTSKIAKELGQPTDDAGSAKSAQTHGFASVNYIDACVMICQQIAEALGHAHKQGVVHRDLKPANVLLAIHGPVMLLDFNLSDELNKDEATRSIVGGTLPYAAPEHLRSLISGERLSPSADLFSLGVILYELLTGRLPFPARPGSEELDIREMIADRDVPPKSVRSLNPDVPPSLDNMVIRLLAASPDQRYQSADEVREDLRRHLESRPLKFVRNRSFSERVKKWSRRHPRLSSSVMITAAALVLVLALAATILFQSKQARAERFLSSVKQLEQELPKIRSYTTLPHADLQVLNRGISIAHDALNRLLVATGKRNESGNENVFPADLTASSGKNEICECLFLMANAHLLVAQKDFSQREDSLELASRFNRQAYDLANDHRTTSIEAQAGDIIDLRNGKDIGRTRILDSGDDLLNAISSMRQDRYREAAVLLESVREQHPHDLSIWLLIGNCYSTTGRLQEAEGCYTTCALMWSNSFFGYFQRGLCRLKMKQYRQAEQDFAKTLQLEPKFIPALINRAVARRSLEKYASAIKDLDESIALEARQTRVYFMRSELRGKLGDQAGAQTDFDLGLKLQPKDELCFIRRGVAWMGRDPERAIADFKSAAAINPRSYAAHRNWAYVLGEKLKRPEEAIEILNRMIPWSQTPHAELVSRGVMYSRSNQRDAAIADAEKALQLNRDSKTLFQVACIYANTARSHDDDAVTAVIRIKEAIEADANWKAIAKIDKDLDPLRNRRDFKTLIENDD